MKKISQRCFIIVFSFSAAIFQNSYATQNAEKLANFLATEHYVRGLAGFAGHQFQEDKNFEDILSEKDASIFLQVLESSKATPAALAYSLCGIKKLGKKLPESIDKKLDQTTQEVSVIRGDIMKKESLLSIKLYISKNGC